MMVRKDENGFIKIRPKIAMLVFGGITLTLTLFLTVGSWACGVGTYTEKSRQIEHQVSTNTKVIDKLNEKLGGMERSMTAVEKDIGWIRQYMEQRAETPRKQ